MKNITSSSTCGTGLLQLQNNLSNSELDVAVVGKPEAGALFTPSLSLSFYLSTLHNLTLTLFTLTLLITKQYAHALALSICQPSIVTDKRAVKRAQHLYIYLHIENTYIY